MGSATRRGAAMLLGLLLAAVGVLLATGPAHAADVYVRVTPSRAGPGELVGIRASCRSNRDAASVESEAFGIVTVHPQHGYLAGTVTIPGHATPGRHRVKLLCVEGPNASTMLTVTAGGGGHQPGGHQPGPGGGQPHPSRGPATGFGGTAGGPDLEGLLLPGGLAVTVAGLVLAMLAARRQRPRTSR
ncbi:hypothetical protein GA0074692_3165 [Micromonospora pallida]|uniref:MYXO-CTERM domain-containing protein n=1 Tax=Micromonospora pallida TaxID=145854 RepID=A0A1C6SQZ9_9ACTN|nr:hypothetical protein [Micromonospora pallida]SCL31723.1 hypothetical protein GA0074692_3165 [Micromonospora pallida]